MRSSLTFWSRLTRGVGAFGLVTGVTSLHLFYGCAGSNTNYDPNCTDPNSCTSSDGGPTGPVDMLCVKMPGTDVPDDTFTDLNCDGIDGDISRAVFVAPTGSDAVGNLGTMESPFLTIGAAIKQADAANVAAGGQIVKDQILVAMGTYSESITLKAGISVYGGYDAGNRWARAAANASVLQGGATAITVQNIAMETHVELMTIKTTTPTTAGGSTYGVLIGNSSGPIVIHNDIIQPADAARGADGTVGAAGSAGGNGAAGTAAGNNGAGGVAGASACSKPGGKGGDGNGGNGNNGADGTVSPGSGGPGGGDSICSNILGDANDGGAGANGANGSNGSNGTAAAQFGTLSASGYTSTVGSSGVPATSGQGGGGGGAGGAKYSFFPCGQTTGPGGGGGGAGGCAGGSGAGGGSGGASVGVFVYASTANVTGCQIQAGKGGDGGNGAGSGFGGAAGAGAPGGAKRTQGAGGSTGTGGSGGNGGLPGVSGAGGGGAGGHSFGIWAPPGSTIMYTGTTFAGSRGPGNNGQGGIPANALFGAGLAQAPNGPAGVNADVRTQ